MLRDIIVIGLSAGGLEELILITKSLPSDFKGSLFVVHHMPAYGSNHLKEILECKTSIPVSMPKNRDKIKAGHIYVSTADYHMILQYDQILIEKGPKENRFRPSIDVLFRSAAYVYGSRVIGLILSGMLNDGSSGLWTIHRLGGITIVQNPETSAFPEMPLNAMEYTEIDHILDSDQIAPILVTLSGLIAPLTNQISFEEQKLLEIEIAIATHGNAFKMGIMEMGEMTPFTCPECHGALTKLQQGRLIRYRCHTGHAYTVSALLSEVTSTIEAKMYETQKGLEEATILLKQISTHFKDDGQIEVSAIFSQHAERFDKKAKILHDMTDKVINISEDIRHVSAM